MPTIDIEGLDAFGLIRDVPSHQLPPEAWSFAENMRVKDGSIERLLGWEQIFGTPPVAPHFLLPLSTIAQTFWLYTSLTKGYVYDGSVHTNITRQTAGSDVDYTATETRQWNGTLLGGIPILNNGNDVPQFWDPQTIATKLRDLTNWDSTRRAKVIRALGPYLVALNITKSGTNYPHQILWSHPADPGAVPISWDETNPAVDAGISELPDVNSGVILDGLPLKGPLYIYKEGSVWRMTPIGGRFVFDFKNFLETVGILAPRCVATTGDGLYHVVATQDDLIRHDGVRAESLLDKRAKRAVFNSIDTSNYLNSFVFPNPGYSEVWFCYPSSGQQHPDKAVIYNHQTGRTLVTEAAGITFRNAAVGTVATSDSETWASAVGTWDTDPDPWSTLERRRVVLADPSATKFYRMDQGVTRDSVDFAATLQRIGLSVLGKTRGGDWIVDFEIRKFFSRFWPKVRGGPINIRVGFQELVDGPILWKNYGVFDPADSTIARGVTLDAIGSGRAIAVEFSTTESVQWAVDGYKVDVSKAGKF